ncbi:JAB domain-containing protein [Geobacter argillaceus]|uniref:DNA repair protein RadC n=1 Tax=Geobacter argillaceus TaxID=345631 RepID=A0A562VPB1_9BACT|nr:JAB domain-containing protein [Geobacter argillaceus]TWJ19765.1 DNA repair protein RadC [Geobacter argillaceus]
MTIETIFGKEESPSKPRSLRFRTIRPVFETLTIKENVPDYINPKTRLTAPRQVWEMFRFLGRESKEWMLVLLLDGKNRLSAVDVCSIGSLNQSIVHPREIFKSALLASAAAIILVHNHPSGDTSPSREDLEISKRLKEASDILGIKLLDHIVIGEDEFTSFVERGLM